MFFEKPIFDLNEKISQIEKEMVRVYNVHNTCEHGSQPYKNFEIDRKKDIKKLQEKILEYKIAIKTLTEC